MGYNSINNMQQVVSRAHGRSLARRNGDRKCSAPLADGLRHSIAEVHFPLKEKPPPWRRGWLSRERRRSPLERVKRERSRSPLERVKRGGSRSPLGRPRPPPDEAEPRSASEPVDKKRRPRSRSPERSENRIRTLRDGTMGDDSIAGTKTKTAPQHVEENLAEVVIRNLRKRGQSDYIRKIIHEIKGF